MSKTEYTGQKDIEKLLPRWVILVEQIWREIEKCKENERKK